MALYIDRIVFPDGKVILLNRNKNASDILSAEDLTATPIDLATLLTAGIAWKPIQKVENSNWKTRIYA